jgi:hypothetical protein
MYFKITAHKFDEDSLYYEYVDELTDYIYQYRNDLYVVKSYYSNEISDGDDEKDDAKKKEVHYFKIEKKQDELKGQQGKYLILYFSTEGITEIENTEKDQGKIDKIIGIVIGIIVVVAIVVVVLVFCLKPKCKKSKKDKNKS